MVSSTTWCINCWRWNGLAKNEEYRRWDGLAKNEEYRRWDGLAKNEKYRRWDGLAKNEEVPICTRGGMV